MSLIWIITGAVGVVFVLIIAALIYRRIPKRLKADKFQEEWKQLQAFCRDKKTWPDAITNADKLLDKALKKRKYKGKSMGERMVSAQRTISNNDQLWFAHNLVKKTIANPALKLKETDVKAALIGFRSALKDIGALKPTESTQADEPEVKQ